MLQSAIFQFWLFYLMYIIFGELGKTIHSSRNLAKGLLQGIVIFLKIDRGLRKTSTLDTNLTPFRLIAKLINFTFTELQNSTEATKLLCTGKFSATHV